MSLNNKIATTVKIPAPLYEEFKVKSIRTKLTLQGLVERCVNLYLSSSGFQEQIDTYVTPKLSNTGSFTLP
jgi:hypothetical protein